MGSQVIKLFVIWLTDKNKERAKKCFEVLGGDPEKLRDSSYIEYQLGLDIEGREVSFGTRDEEYYGKSSVRVVWIGRKPDPNLSRSAARFERDAEKRNAAVLAGWRVLHFTPRHVRSGLAVRVIEALLKTRA